MIPRKHLLCAIALTAFSTSAPAFAQPASAGMGLTGGMMGGAGTTSAGSGGTVTRDATRGQDLPNANKSSYPLNADGANGTPPGLDTSGPGESGIMTPRGTESGAGTAARDTRNDNGTVSGYKADQNPKDLTGQQIKRQPSSEQAPRESAGGQATETNKTKRSTAPSNSSNVGGAQTGPIDQQ